MEETNSQVLQRLYYDNKQGYLATDKFHKKLKANGYNIPLKKVKSWLSKQPAYTTTIPPRKPPVFNTVWADYPGSNYQMDTMFLTNYAYRGYKYVLLVIDIHSRYLGALPMKKKTAHEYTEAFHAIIEKQMGRKYPKTLNTDGEYNAIIFERLLRAKGVEKHTLTPPGQPYKNAIVERVIRTLRGMFARWRAGDPQGGLNWPGALSSLVDNYNETYHRTIRQKPADVWNGRSYNLQKVRYVANELRVGMYVRYLIRENNVNGWQKLDDMKWSNRIYRIAEAVKTRWRLEPLKGDPPMLHPEYLYMEYELKQVPYQQLNKVTNRVLVSAQKDNATLARGLNTHDLGPVSTNKVTGVPYIAPPFTQLTISGTKRKQIPTDRYSPPPSKKQERKRKIYTGTKRKQPTRNSDTKLYQREHSPTRKKPRK